MKVFVYANKYTLREIIGSGKAPLPSDSVYSEEVSEYWPTAGYTLVGTADVTITLFSMSKIKGGMIDALKGRITQVRADAQKAITIIEGEIQSLLAVENKESSDLSI